MGIRDRLTRIRIRGLISRMQAEEDVAIARQQRVIDRRWSRARRVRRYMVCT